MSPMVTVQIQDVPDDVRAELERQARLANMTLDHYLSVLLKTFAFSDYARLTEQDFSRMDAMPGPRPPAGSALAALHEARAEREARW
jgi:hypothetical protein